MSNYNVLVGKNIKYARESKSFTKKEFSNLIGISPSFLGMIEDGERGTSIKNLIKISELLQISLDDMLKIDMTEEGDEKSIKANVSKKEDKKFRLNAYLDKLDEKGLELILRNVVNFIDYVGTQEESVDKEHTY